MRKAVRSTKRDTWSWVLLLNGDELSDDLMGCWPLYGVSGQALVDEGDHLLRALLRSPAGQSCIRCLLCCCVTAGVPPGLACDAGPACSSGCMAGGQGHTAGQAGMQRSLQPCALRWGACTCCCAAPSASKWGGAQTLLRYSQKVLAKKCVQLSGHSTAETHRRCQLA